MTRALRLFRINAGSCNGCDVELTATACLSRFGLDRLGVVWTEEPESAGMVLITGPLTVRVKERVLELYERVPEPKVTVAVGACPASGGVFRDSYAVHAPLERYLPVHVNVAGCPPRPQAIVEGVNAAVALWRLQQEAYVLTIGPRGGSDGGATQAQSISGRGIRGKVRYNAAACSGCRVCQHVCAAGAISFTEAEDGLHFALEHNACAFCGMCVHYCKSGALEHSGDWHTAHYQQKKSTFREIGTVVYRSCSGCGEPLIPVPVELLRISFQALNRDIDRLKTLCPECRLKHAVGGAER